MRLILLMVTFFLLFPAGLYSQICDIKKMLNECPMDDPAISEILNDFEIRLNGVLVTDFPCTEPVSSMAVSDYTDPLIYLQTLRVIYHMSKNTEGVLPWTAHSFYTWMKNAVDGINIVPGLSGGQCCFFIDGKLFIAVGEQNEFNREYDKGWMGIGGNITFVAHEVRHTDNNYGYGHSSCCGITNGCDDVYNENDLGSYGVAYWLFKSWLTGLINVGIWSSHTPGETVQLYSSYINTLNSHRNRFCSIKPDIIINGEINEPFGYHPYNNSVTIDGNSLIASQQDAIYQWIDCDNNNLPVEGETSREFRPEQSGSYAVRIIKNSCESISECKPIEVIISALDNTMSEAVQVYPNPAHSELVIDAGDNRGKYSYEILEPSGKILMTEKFSGENTHKIPFEWSPGVYFVNIRSGKGKATFRVVKK